MTSKNRNAKAAVPVQQGSDLDPLAFIERLCEKQRDWNEKHYRTTTEKLLDLLAECAEARAKLVADATLRKNFHTRFDNSGLKLKDGMSLTAKLVRYIFQITGNRASAYARVIDTARDAGVAPADLPAWVGKQKGIEAVRRVTKDGVTPADKVRNAVDKAESALKQSKPLFTIDQLPQALHADVNNAHEFTLALVRHDSSTGQGHIVCASAKAVLIKQFLASVAATVVVGNESEVAARNDATSLEARNAVIAAAVAAANAVFDANEKVAA
jgi:hypothetical protein